MPRTAKANPVTLNRKSGSELLDESGELHDPVLVSQKADHERAAHRSASAATSRIAEVRRLAAPSANDEPEADLSKN